MLVCLSSIFFLKKTVDELLHFEKFKHVHLVVMPFLLFNSKAIRKIIIIERREMISIYIFAVVVVIVDVVVEKV